MSGKPPGNSIAIKRKPEILRRMATGEPLTKIALDLGYTSNAGIIERLGNDPDYELALQQGAFARLEKREGELEQAADNVSVTRADRLLGHARWLAERIDRKRFGDQPVAAVSGAALADLLLAVSNRMLQEKQINSINQIDNKSDE
jgi:hypothetical protein